MAAEASYMQVPQTAPMGMLQEVPAAQPTVAVQIGRHVAAFIGPTQDWPGAHIDTRRQSSPVLAVPAQSHSVIVDPEG